MTFRSKAEGFTKLEKRLVPSRGGLLGLLLMLAEISALNFRHEFGHGNLKCLTQNKNGLKTGIVHSPFQISEGVQMHARLDG